MMGPLCKVNMTNVTCTIAGSGGEEAAMAAWSDYTGGHVFRANHSMVTTARRKRKGCISLGSDRQRGV
jgi:hypothetical protein